MTGKRKQNKKYRLINHTADLGIEVYGKELQELFSNAGFALFDIMTDISRVKETTERVITVEGNDLEQLMVNWLNDLLYLFDVEGLLFKRFEVQEVESKKVIRDEVIGPSEGKITKNSLTNTSPLVTRHYLNALIAGECYDPNRHIIETAVKAATYHQIQVVKENSKWRAMIIIDL
ncbi:MAG TPA: archease [Candidatus Brocadiia bacterium]|nr:archease [Candidatus Brocadiales bacterium]